MFLNLFLPSKLQNRISTRNTTIDFLNLNEEDGWSAKQFSHVYIGILLMENYFILLLKLKRYLLINQPFLYVQLHFSKELYSLTSVSVLFSLEYLAKQKLRFFLIAFIRFKIVFHWKYSAELHGKSTRKSKNSNYQC